MLKARPAALQAAADALAPPKGERTSAALRIGAQRDRLLAIPVKELARYRINVRALAILPVLAVEVSNAPLRERVIALSVAQAEQLSWSQLAQLLPWIYADDQFRRRIHGRAKSDPPPQSAPRWLRQHWRKALGRDAPAAALAEIGLSEEPTLARLLDHLEVPAGTPLSEALLSAVVHSRDDAWLSTQPFTETLRFLESSGTAPSVRVPLMRRVLARYAVRIREPAQLHGPLLELMMLAKAQLHGWPRPHASGWHGLPASVLRVGRWCARRDALIEAFGKDTPRTSAWMRWLRYIERIETVGAVVGVVIAARVFAEPSEAPTTCRVYSPATWADFMGRQADSDTPLPPPRPEVRLMVTDTERDAIDRFITERCGLT